MKRSQKFTARQPECVAPMLQICATMWHETEPEMVKMLKSFFRLDMDQMALRESQRVQKLITCDYYEFEAHIFFDDAMTPHKKGNAACEVNTFVKCLVKAVDEASRAINKESAAVGPPDKMTTPYGGRLVWCMPGGNKLTVHLKDKLLVRNKKRWSQVMSMYYHLLLPPASGVTSLPDAARVYLLHVDGDVDFRPAGVRVLVDLMNRDANIGAVCGRTHPTGTGPLVWCQQFEYGLSHWLQKATEDVFGCVLCCPGCFSLLRGSALLQVLDRFSAPPVKPRQFLLENQGEDRWLCSLLIEAGWSIKYSSTAQCLTMAPRSLKEFYNQRRRWTPSGFFHTIDLITNLKGYTKNNDQMKVAYVLYQAVIFVISLLAGSLILLLLSKTLVVVSMSHVRLHYAILINLIPVVAMATACLVATSTVQLFLARVLTVVYSAIQLLVLSFAVYTAYAGGICSPSAIFFLIIVLSVVLAGILHPTELIYIFCGVPYFMFAPSMYLFMMIYALSNMYIISWGTREVKTKSPPSDSSENDLSTEQHYSGVPVIRENENGKTEVLSCQSYDAWSRSEALGNGPTVTLTEREREFFQALLETHLKPESHDPEQQRQITSSLKQLRNKTITAYYIINAAFLVIVLALEEFSGQLTVPWSCETAPTLSLFIVLSTVMMLSVVSFQVLGMLVHRLLSARREYSRRGCCWDRAGNAAAAAAASAGAAAGAAVAEMGGGTAGVYSCTLGDPGSGGYSNHQVFIVDDYDDYNQIPVLGESDTGITTISTTTTATTTGTRSTTVDTTVAATATDTTPDTCITHI